MKKKLWTFDNVVLDIDDRVVAITAVHKNTCTEVRILRRLGEVQMVGSVNEVRARAEHIASDRIQDFASFLDAWGLE